MARSLLQLFVAYGILIGGVFGLAWYFPGKPPAPPAVQHSSSEELPALREDLGFLRQEVQELREKLTRQEQWNVASSLVTRLMQDDLSRLRIVVGLILKHEEEAPERTNETNNRDFPAPQSHVARGDTDAR